MNAKTQTTSRRRFAVRAAVLTALIALGTTAGIHQVTANTAAAAEPTVTAAAAVEATEAVEQAAEPTVTAAAAVEATEAVEQAVETTEAAEQAVETTEAAEQAVETTETVEQAVETTEAAAVLAETPAEPVAPVAAEIAFAFTTWIANNGGQEAVDACTGGVTYHNAVSEFVGKPYYPIHNHCGGAPILDLNVGDQVQIDNDTYTVVAARDVVQGDTADALQGLPGTALIQTCYANSNAMRVVALQAN